MERYRRALGSFIHDFTVLEVSRFRLLCVAAGVTEEVGQALFSGARADGMLQQIRRCYRAREWKIEPHLESALSQVVIINSARNAAVHYLTLQVEDDERAVLATNHLRYPRENAKEVRISPESLDEAGSDCRRIGAVLSVATFEIREPGSTGKLGQNMKSAPPAWRYRPPSPDTPPRTESSQSKAQGDRTKRVRQQRPSRRKDQP